MATALDTAQVTTRVLPALRTLGYRTVIRYLSTNVASDKCVKEQEAHAVSAAGLRLGLVFEVYGGVNSFAHDDITAESGKRHGAFAAGYAPRVGAPAGAAVYFAIDTDVSAAQLEARVLPYFREVHKAMADKYLVGVYGSGLVCARLLDDGLTDLAWLAQSTGWRGYRDFLASKRWSILQEMPKRLAGLDADPDVLSTTLPDVGDFVPFGDAAPVKPPAPQPAATDFPPKPDFPPLVSNDARAAVFGRFNYTAAPQPDNPEHVNIDGAWLADNIVWVPIPQMLARGLGEPGHTGGMLFHRLGAQQLKDTWAAWEAAGLLDRVRTFDGSFSPRFVRGSTTSLSNHAFGASFDVNYQWNQLGAEPAAVGQVGSVRELVPIANAHGFFWGGHYNGRKDGMHFELAKVNQTPAGSGLPSPPHDLRWLQEVVGTHPDGRWGPETQAAIIKYAESKEKIS